VLGLEPVGHPEHDTGAPHVLTEHDYARILRERVVQRPVERARHRPLLHPSASSRCRSNEEGGAAYTQSNIHSAGGAGVAITPARTSSAYVSASSSHAITNRSSAMPVASSQLRNRSIGSVARARSTSASSRYRDASSAVECAPIR